VPKEVTAINETRNRENVFQRGDLRPVGNSKNRFPTLIPVIQLDDNDFVFSDYEGEIGLIIPRGTHDHLLIIRKANTFFGKAKKPLSTFLFSFVSCTTETAYSPAGMVSNTAATPVSHPFTGIHSAS